MEIIRLVVEGLDGSKMFQVTSWEAFHFLLEMLGIL